MQDGNVDDKLHRREEEVYYGVGRFLLEVVKVFVLALVIIVPIRVFLFQPFFVQGASMEPSFANGEYLIINEFGYKTTHVGIGENDVFSVHPFRDLSRGDVIVFRYPKNPKQFFIKRVIALPGEKIVVQDGRVTIHNKDFPGGFVLDETEYLREAAKTRGRVALTLGEDEFFVMGDNRSASHDSRSWGALSVDDVIGKVLLRAWPPSRVGVYPDGVS